MPDRVFLDRKVSLAVYPPVSNTLPNLTRAVGPSEMLLVSMAEHVRQAVVQRDDDVLTPNQVRREWPHVKAQ